MPTKKTTKSKKGKPQSQTQAQPAIASSYVHLGPPFAGSGAYPGGAWGIFPADEARRFTPCPGFWGYSKHYPTTGGIVSQLGAEPGTGAAGCTLYAGYQYTFEPTVAGEHVIVVTMNLGAVTRRPRSGRVQVSGVLQIRTADMRGSHWADFRDDLPSNTAITLVVKPTLERGRLYSLRFGVAPIVENAGFQSYGEAILNSAELVQYLPYGAPASQLAPPSAAKSDDGLSSLLNSGNEQEARNISLHDAVTFGVSHNS
jgi:hypothetical protein